MPEKCRILGIDTGMAKAGWAITDGPTSLVDCGIFKTAPSKKHPTMNAETIERMRQMYDQIKVVLRQYHPDAIIVETVPPNAMAKRDQVFTVQTMFRVFGMSYKYAEMAAVTSKKRFTGNGRAEKKDMKARCIELFPDVNKKFTWDTYDAIAISVNGHLLSDQDWWQPSQEDQCL